MEKKKAVKEKKKTPDGSKKVYEKSFAMDVGKFKSAQFAHRYDEIPVVNSDLKEFFPPGTKPMLKVRGLTAMELARADEEVQTNREARNEATLDNLGTDAMVALRTLIRTHLGKDTPDSHVKMLHIVHIGMVEPRLEYAEVIKFANAFPVEFRLMFIKINELTGRGQDFLGKQKDSGASLESPTA